MTNVRQFGIVDFVLFSLMLGVSIAIGIFYAVKGYRSTASDFLVARKKVSLVPVSLSLMASFMSAITIIGMPAEIITNGTQYVMYVFGISLGCVVSALTFVPLLYPIKFISSFEYIEKRFNSKAMKTVGATILCVSQILYIGTAALAPSTALDAVTGFPVWATVFVTIGIATLYTFLGGIRAVVWTDAFQTVIMVGGILAIIIKGSIEVGGMSEVWSVNEQWGRINFININPDITERHTLWGLIIGGCITWTAVYGVNQASIQRYCALPTLKQARMSLLLNVLLVIVLFVTVGLAGIVIFAYYAQRGCDPLSGKFVKARDQIVPWFVMEVVGYPGVPGLFLSSLFSGALSSISSCLSAIAAIGLEDFVKPILGQRLSEKKNKFISKLLVLVTGCLGMALAFSLNNLDGTILQISLTFTTSAFSPLLGMFILGGAVPFANWIGTISGSIVGLVMPMWLGIGQYSLQISKTSLPLPDSTCIVNMVSNITMSNITTTTAPPSVLTGADAIYQVSYLWLPTIGTLSTVIVGIVVSLATGGWNQNVDSYYMFSFLPYGRKKNQQVDDDSDESERMRLQERI